MSQQLVQNDLVEAYAKWKVGLRFNDAEAKTLRPPLLLSVTEDYCRAEKRIIVFGQETNGWSWNDNLKTTYPRYPTNWSGTAIESMFDFMENSDGVEKLCWAYDTFTFSKYQPKSRKSPFWQAFREVQAWPGAGVIWSNVSRCDYAPPGGKNGHSIFQAPEDVREELATGQKDLLLRELEILKPNACVFFS